MRKVGDEAGGRWYEIEVVTGSEACGTQRKMARGLGRAALAFVGRGGLHHEVQNGQNPRASCASRRNDLQAGSPRYWMGLGSTGKRPNSRGRAVLAFVGRGGLHHEVQNGQNPRASCASRRNDLAGWKPALLDGSCARLCRPGRPTPRSAKWPESSGGARLDRPGGLSHIAVGDGQVRGLQAGFRLGSALQDAAG